MLRYRYNKQVSPPAPFVDLTVGQLIEGGISMRVPAQVDTAADVTVITRRVVDELRLVPFDEVPTLGFGGHVIQTSTYLIRVAIRDLPPIDIEAVASPDEPYCLLGRDVLNGLRITLDGPGLVMEIA